MALLAVALAVGPEDGAARVERARYTLDVQLTAIRDELSTLDGATVIDTHRTTVWRARSRKPFVLERRGTKRRPSYRFQTVALGAARKHRVQGWIIYRSPGAAGCRVYPNDIGPLPGSQLRLRVRSAGRGSTPYQRLAIVASRARAMVTTLLPPGPCPPGWFPGASMPCPWCAVQPVTMMYPFGRPDLLRKVRFRRRFVLRRMVDPGVRPSLREETADAGSVTVRDTSLTWKLTFRPIRRR